MAHFSEAFGECRAIDIGSANNQTKPWRSNVSNARRHGVCIWHVSKRCVAFHNRFPIVTRTTPPLLETISSADLRCAKMRCSSDLSFFLCVCLGERNAVQTHLRQQTHPVCSINLEGSKQS